MDYPRGDALLKASQSHTMSCREKLFAQALFTCIVTCNTSEGRRVPGKQPVIVQRSTLLCCLCNQKRMVARFHVSARMLSVNVCEECVINPYGLDKFCRRQCVHFPFLHLNKYGLPKRQRDGSLVHNG